MDEANGALILVVEDDPAGRALVSTLLEQAGYRVAAIGSGEEALTLAAERPPDLVVLDLGLPGIDGFETCRRLKRQQGETLAVLMLSGRGRKAIVQGLGAGADDYLPKPFDVDEFWARIEALLRIRAAEAAARRRAERLLSLQRVTSAVAGRLEENEVLQVVLTEARELLAADGVAFYGWDAEAAVLRPTHVLDPPGAAPPGVRARGVGLVGQALEQRRPICVNNYVGWSGRTDESRAAGVSAAIAAPVLLGDEVLGVITARKLKPASQFEEEDAQLLGLLAGQAASALNNARLYAARRTEAANAAERAAQLEAVMESMADGVLMVDRSGVLTSANRAAAELLGRPRQELVGAPLSAALPPLCWPDGRSISADDLPLLTAVRTGRALVDCEVAAEIRNRERILLETCAPIRDANGVVGAVSVFRDVTERRRAEERQTQAEKLRALGQLASGVAHDVNNVLASVLGRAELARLEVERGGHDQRRLAEALRLIEQAAEDGAHTVRRIQDFARVRRDADLAVVRLDEVVRDTVELTRPQWRDAAQAAGRTIDVVVDLEPELFVSGQPAELREVLTNLLLNAVDAMPRGGTIMVTGRRVGGTVHLQVADTGVGMSAVVRRRVFEPFFTTKGDAGNGLGLAVSYGVVQRRGGQISVESALGEGTTFTLELPLSERPPDRPVQVEAPPSRARRILVVDDEPALATVLQRLLESEGHVVTTCTSGAEALRAFDSSVHDLVMTDLGMAELNGLQLASAIHRRSPATPVILVTGWGNELDPEHPPRDIARILAKPYRLSSVLEAVSEVLDEPAASSPRRGRNGTRAGVR